MVLSHLTGQKARLTAREVDQLHNVPANEVVDLRPADRPSQRALDHQQRALPDRANRHSDQAPGAGLPRHSSSRACSTTSVSAGWMYKTPEATWSTVLPRHMAWISGWIRAEACGPMMWAPSSSRVSGSARTFTKLLVSSSAQP